MHNNVSGAFYQKDIVPCIMALPIHAKKEKRLPLAGKIRKGFHIKYLFVCLFSPSGSCGISRSLPAGKMVQATSIEELVCSDEGLECVMTEGLECDDRGTRVCSDRATKDLTTFYGGLQRLFVG